MPPKSKRKLHLAKLTEAKVEAAREKRRREELLQASSELPSSSHTPPPQPSTKTPGEPASSSDRPPADCIIGTTEGTLRRRVELLQEHFTSKCSLEDEDVSDAGNIIMPKNLFQAFFDSVAGVCQECCAKLELSMKVYSADTSITVTCKSCKKVQYSHVPETLHDRFTVNNTNLVYSSLKNGTGYSGYSDVASLLNVKPLSRGGYYSCQKFIGEKIVKVNEERQEIIQKCVSQNYETKGKKCDDDGVMNGMVTYDGSWMTKGHKSHIGVGCVVDSDTGFILDHEVLSNDCVQCTKLENKRAKMTKGKFDALKSEHKPKCQKNFNGKSGAMEAEGAVRMWQRSVKKNKMRYTTFIGDGDSSAYKSVIGLHKGKGPYDGVEMAKEECVNHVSKRFGSRLRKLKDTEVTEVPVKSKPGKTRKKKTLGGKSKLTDKVLEMLPYYYGQAIRRQSSSTVEELRKDIMATFYHCTSTDDEPRHMDCPPGSDSWCFYQRAIANNETPRSHKDMKVKFTLDPPERTSVIKVYVEMTRKELLVKCMLGKTQNVNEGIHSKLWHKLQKTKYYSLNTVKYGTALTVLEHNFGHENVNIPCELGFLPTVHGMKHLQSQNKQRRASSTRKKPRKKRSGSAPDSDYGAGEF